MRAPDGREVDVNPEWFVIVDERTGKVIPWSAIELVEREGRPW
jgi:hypothetical protein